MTGVEIGAIAIVLMLLAVYFGMHIGIALMAVSFIGIWMVKSPELAARMLAAAASDSIREHLFGVVPLFVLMGILVSVSQLGRDTFDVAQRVFARLRGGLGIATVAANAVFAAITGISIASASVFTKVAVPEMIRHGYTGRFAVGTVTGSSVLGMLIPPSLLFIVYGVLAEESVGRMFVAGIVPGLVLALAFSLMIVAMAVFMPSFVGRPQAVEVAPEPMRRTLAKGGPVIALVALVLGGLYGGIFTPTEAGAVGALGALLIALARRRLTGRKMWDVLLETGHVSVSVLFLIMAASLYSRMLALTGIPATIGASIIDLGLGPTAFIVAYICVVLLLGCIIDSVSIMLIVLPIVLPIARDFQLDIIWFGVITVLAVEIGLLTPPFGLSVYTVKATLTRTDIGIKDIFIGSVPFVLCMLVVLALIVAFPPLATWLAYL
jgi:tripartite ATP-independent transporter DctM subunit